MGLMCLMVRCYKIAHEHQAEHTGEPKPLLQMLLLCPSCLFWVSGSIFIVERAKGKSGAN